MTMINQLLKVKGHDYFSVGPEETVYAAIEKMAEKNVGSVLVMDGATLVASSPSVIMRGTLCSRAGALRRPSSETSCQRGSRASNPTIRSRTAWHS